MPVTEKRHSMADKRRWPRCGLEPGLQAVLFLGLFVYVWKGIEPHLLYYGFGVFTPYPVFTLEGSFVRAALSTPGGILSALAALLAQSYSHAWLGALVIVTVLGVLFLGIQRLLRSMQAWKFRDLAWIPVILALMVYNHYENPLPIVLAVALSVWVAVLYGSLGARTLSARAGLFLLCFAIVYYWAGASAFVFASIVCLTEALRHRKLIGAILSIALAFGGAFVLGRLVFALELQATFTVGTPWDPTGDPGFSALVRLPAIALYAFVPGLMLLASLAGVGMKVAAKMRLGRRKQDAQPTEEPKRLHRWRAYDRRLGIALRLLLVTATAFLALLFSRTYIRYERALHYYAQQRNWEQVIALAHRMRGKQTFTHVGMFEVNRALAHQGRLGSELCTYLQDGTKALFLSFEETTGRLQNVKLLEWYLDLGCLNAAEKNAYELLENDGPSPYILEAMIRIHLAKGQFQSAQIVFKALQKYLGGRAYARQWQAVMANPAQAQTHARIQAWRRVACTRDDAAMGVSFEPTLKRLLQETPDHRLAFEYLMAYYLLKHQRAKFVGGLPLLRPLGYKQLPRHYAEALLVHSLETKSPVKAQGWTIDPALYDQFRQMRGIVTNAQGDHHATFDTLAPKYGDTYTFYSMFNVCGVK